MIPKVIRMISERLLPNLTSLSRMALKVCGECYRIYSEYYVRVSENRCSVRAQLNLE